jgi:osmotically inducible protein OsmC
MPRIERTARIGWTGNVARGEGLLSADTGAFTDLGYSLPTRIGQPEGKTSPEELLAAAHGGCFTMSLASELTQVGHPPGQLDVTCQIVMDEVEGQGHQIVGSNLTALVDVPGLDEATLASAVALADENCPFSSLLKRGGVSVTISAELSVGA